MPFNGPSARASGLRLNKLVHMNFSTGKESTWFCGPDSLIQEPCFVPRRPGAPEGDGQGCAKGPLRIGQSARE